MLLLNKVDLLGRLDVDVDRLPANAARVSPTLPVIQVLAKDGRGCEAWVEWLLAERARKAGEAERR